MKLETMSRNVVDIMFTLARNEMLGRILAHDVQNPYEIKRDTDGSKMIDSDGNYIFVLPKPEPIELIKPDSSKARIFPYPFDPEATEMDGSFIRVYYNSGEFSPEEVIAESQIHIDIIVSKSLWLINNDNNESLIRAYDIMGRVVDLVGRRSVGRHAKVKFTGYSHLYVNTKFDAIRLYAQYMSVESQ